METDAETLGQTLDGAQGVVWKSWGRMEGPEEDRDATRPTESTKLDPWRLPETEPPTKEQVWVGPRPSAPLQQMCSLVFIWSPTAGAGAFLESAYGYNSPNWASIYGFIVGELPCPTILNLCARVGWYQGGCPCLRGEGGGKQGEPMYVRYREERCRMPSGCGINE